MANFSDRTRKEQVLARLQAANGGWVDGPDLANEEVGGSEGLRRLRELADEGHNVRKRQHPDPQRDIFQYRLGPRQLDIPVEEIAVQYTMGSRPEPAIGVFRNEIVDGQYVQVPIDQIEPSEPPEYPKTEAHRQERISSAVKRKEDGTYEYVPPQRPLHEQLTTPPDPPQPEGASFASLPGRIDYGSVAICPRCHSKTTRGRTPKEETKAAEKRGRRGQREKEGSKLIDDDGVLLFRDPHSSKPIPCSRCNGYGIVPNIGPVPMSAP